MNAKIAAPIGVFDSGVGGLTVVLEMLRQMPAESLVYYADTAHVPYGPRDPQELKGFATAITKFLISRGCKMIIIACNTSTSLAYEELSARFSVPLVGVIEPGVDKALEITQNKRIGVIGTVATINSGAYQRIIKNKNPEAEIVAVPCPLFVPLIEDCKTEGQEVYQTAWSYLEPMREKGVDTLVLGCTHYPFLLPVLQEIMGPSTRIIDPARETVRRAKESLSKMGLLREGGSPSHKYYSSGDPREFQHKGSSFLKRDIGRVEGISLD